MTSDRYPSRFLGRLSGKSAIVTGAGTRGSGFGTGRAIACLLAGEGASVCLVDRDEDAAHGTRELIVQRGGRAIVEIGDVTNKADCEGFATRTCKAFGGVDILVNNVGISSPASDGADKVDLGEWQRIMDTNLISALLMTGACAPAMRKAGGGSVVNIASIAGMLAYGGLGYGPSKAALIQMTRELALVHGPDGIRANSVSPGHIYTPMLDGLIPPVLRDARRKAGPLAVEGDAWDIAHAVLFLASDEARFITGTCLPVDGGVTAIGSMAAAAMMAGD